MASSAVPVIGGLLLTACVTLTACGNSLTTSAAGSTATTAETSGVLSTSRASQATTAADKPSSRTSSPAPDEVPACANTDLIVSVGSSGVAMGHVGSTIVFTNGSDRQCTLTGYPRLAGMDTTGREVTQALRTLSGYMGGNYTMATVQMAPGGRASALVEGTDIPTGGATTCPVYPRLVVTAPKQTHSQVLAATMPGCSLLQVHPVVAGATGRA